MGWLQLLFALLAGFGTAFLACFLSSAWKRRNRMEPMTLRIEAMLPGHDCGLCGRDDCRSYAAHVAEDGGDPGSCAPGGSRVEAAIREALSGLPGDPRNQARRAVVRCGGGEGRSFTAFDYDGRESCASAAALYGGPLRCKEGCIGFGSCAAACPFGAIRVEGGLARVVPGLCSGCGICVEHCPTGVIALVPEDEGWYVACASKRQPEARLADCMAACTGCRECVQRSRHGEFEMKAGIARATGAVSGKYSDIAPRCPTGAILKAGEEKSAAPPTGGPAAGL